MLVKNLLSDLNSALEKYGLVIHQLKRETPKGEQPAEPETPRKRKAARLAELMKRNG